jgi:WD40 repeat protein
MGTRTTLGNTGVAALALPVLLSLLATGCSVWQARGAEADYVNADVHRGAEALAFDADSTLLASGGWDGKVAVWKPGGLEPEAVWQAHDGYVLGIGFFAERLITGGQDGRLKVWSTDGQVLRSVDTGSTVNRLVLVSDTVATGHYDGSVRLWRLPDLRHQASFVLHSRPVSALAGNEQTGRIASSGYDGRVYLIDPSATPKALATPPTDPRSLEFSPDGRVLFGGGWVRLFRWDLSADSFTSLPTPHWGALSGLHFVPEEGSLASISRINDSSVFFLNPQTGDAVRQFRRQSICGGAVRVSPDGRYLATTGDDGIVRVWNLHPGLGG